LFALSKRIIGRMKLACPKLVLASGATGIRKFLPVPRSVATPFNERASHSFRLFMRVLALYSLSCSYEKCAAAKAVLLGASLRQTGKTTSIRDEGWFCSILGKSPL
jgi:hypothetical protein